MLTFPLVLRSYLLRRDVAQSGSALEWGSRGRRFKSFHPDQKVRQRDLRKRKSLFCRLCPPAPSFAALPTGGGGHAARRRFPRSSCVSRPRPPFAFWGGIRAFSFCNAQRFKPCGLSFRGKARFFPLISGRTALCRRPAFCRFSRARSPTAPSAGHRRC